MRKDNPQRALWLAVVAQAAEDAIHGASLGGGKHHRIAATKAARAWLTTPSRDLAEVCHLASLDPHAVMEHMRKRIAEAPSPEELVGRSKKTPRPPITYRGETMTIAEWSDRTGVPASIIRNRLWSGWPTERALGPLVRRKAGKTQEAEAA